MKKYPQIAIVYGLGDITDALYTVKNTDIVPQKEYKNLVERRANGELTDKGVYLPSSFDWHIVKDSYNELVLIATRHEIEASTPRTVSSEDENEF